MNETMRYKCNVCKKIVNSRQEVPIEHGTMSITIHPDKPKPSKKCDGFFYAITSD